MGQPKKKGESGAAINYISRAKALKRLQLSLKDFRRLCILKGIYPHEPKRKLVAGKGNSSLKTYYFLKDIQFLGHEPIITSFRKLKIFMRKIKKAESRNDKEEISRLHEIRPTIKLDHIVKERYPTFLDALRDLDDSLSMCMLFANFPKSYVVPTRITQICRRLTIEFLNYVIESHSLRKVFISIKGYYFQAEIQGQPITWIVPHQFSFRSPEDVDFKIMVTFVDFYATMLGFVNFKLYNHLNLQYPPTLSASMPSLLKDSKDFALSEELIAERVGALNQSLSRIIVPDSVDDADIDEFPQTDDPDKLRQLKDKQARVKKLQKLFLGLKFYINREVPREQFVFMIRCFGGEVSWDKTLFIGATFDENDPCVTHHIIDRPIVPKQLVNKYFVQPQYICDCINNCALLPVEKYYPGVMLPPHLSPFVEDEDSEYITPDRFALSQRKLDTEAEPLSDDENADKESDEDNGKSKQGQNKKSKLKSKDGEVFIKSKPYNKTTKMGVQVGKVVEDNQALKAAEAAAEEKRLAILTIPKKKKRLYDKIVHGRKRKATEANKLKAKRAKFDAEQKAKK